MLQLFRTLKPGAFSKSAYSEIINGFDSSTYVEGNLSDFCLDQINYYAELDQYQDLLLWSLFLSFAKSKNAIAWVRTDEEGDDIFAIAFPKTVVTEDGTETTTWSALVFDQELDSVEPINPEDLAEINQLIARAFA